MSSTNGFAYNPRSEVTDAAMGASTYSYSYDDIGNREWAAADASLSTYLANGLNQYTVVTNAGAGVAVAYDVDGNMITNGVWVYAWDAENRMVSASNTVSGAAVANAYDHLNRRVRKTAGPVTRHYVWDGWNIVAETAVDAAAGTTNVHFYTWGLDLSGTPQGAGGVGGLLADTACNNQPATCDTYFPCYDANGNVTEYVESNGTVRGRYGYSPFGEITAQSGDMADSFTHRFSTKPFDVETGLTMYQLRPFSPPLGRWPNRDPIGTGGGYNEYVFVGNDPVSRIDPFGLEVFTSITMKRKHVKWLALLKENLGKKASNEDTYGHWWMEFGSESYGWWPKNTLGLIDTLRGVPGELNGQTTFGGTATTDPHHGDSADEFFHPQRHISGKLEAGEVVGGTTCECASEEQIKQCLRAFAVVYKGNWSYPWGQNCHSFQKSAMGACCLKK